MEIVLVIITSQDDTNNLYGSPSYNGRQYVLGKESLNSGLQTRQQLQDFFLCIYRNSFIKELAFSSIEINDEFGGSIIEGLSGHRSLEKLHISNGVLGGMGCKAIGNILTHPLSKLKDLDLPNCYLDNKNFGILCDALSGNSTIKRLNFTRNKRITSTGWQSLSDVIGHPNCKLAKLSLKSTNLNDESIVMLGSSISSSSLKALDLSFNRNISRAGWQWLINRLSQNINIMSLGLIENSIDDLSVAALANIGNLKFLDLSFCHFFTPMGFWPFFNALQRRGIQLTKLDISGINIDNEGAAALGSLLNNMSTLRTLQMSNMSISGHNFTSQQWRTLFTTLLDSNLDLVKLHLGANNIDDEGIRLLTRVLLTMSSLRYLNLGDNREATPIGWLELSTYLQSPTCVLKELDLDDNNINDDAVVSFARALTSNKTLENLSLDECAEEDDNGEMNELITERGWEAVATLLCNKTSILDTHNSNHILNWLNTFVLPDDVISYLELNKNEDKAEVTRQKILQSHFSTDDNLQELLHMELEMMPSVISWIGRPAHTNWKGTNVSGLSTMFNLLKRVPDLFDSSPQKKRSGAGKRSVMYDNS